MQRKLLKILIMLAVCLLLVAYLIKRPGITFKSEVGEQLVSVAALQQHVRVLSAEITARSFDDTDGLDLAAAYIEAQLRQYSDQVRRQSYEVSGQDYHNIIARFGPDQGEALVVGAHYDAYGGLPGADDNASGVAGLLELGRLLQQSEWLNFPVILVAYTLEEPPIYAGDQMGSVIHANSLEEPIRLMVSLEMIGYFTAEPDSQHYPSSLMGLLYPSTGDFIAVVDQLFSFEAQQLKKVFNQYTDIAAYSINAPVWIPGIDFSDHRNYWALGLPAIMVTDTAFYRNKNYHTSEDTFEKLDYEKMAQVVLGVYRWIELM